ncbi:hypothetical protein [Croceicoccus pelagius]|uniref:Uncharacterized protein n=1 Tax=Croceicoccus pelagius TaxID=1703341 RepID=A0A917DGW5_9SPHN|nr:hypothetical protein [Croceicoccus pelagius]GGD34598.1 hypothetical protein GCM10010989_05910 [Croceicoccus pelagius]
MEQSLGEIARKWSKNSEKGKGLRLDAEALDQLNEIGVGELIQAEAAKQQRLECGKRRNPSTSGESTGSSMTENEMAVSDRRSFKLSGTTEKPDEIAAVRRARNALKMQNDS